MPVSHFGIISKDYKFAQAKFSKCNYLHCINTMERLNKSCDKGDTRNL